MNPANFANTTNTATVPINRVLDLSAGVTMVVSDLHGDKDAFARHVGRFLQLHSRKRVQRILFLGDLIHSDGPESDDASLQIVIDIMRMRATLGQDAVVALLGNHELPHIYGVILRRGQFEYTPRFERMLSTSGRRAEVLAFFEQMPFYVRTASGVAFTHAGPEGTAIAQFEELRRFDHAAIRSENAPIAELLQTANAFGVAEGVSGTGSLSLNLNAEGRGSALSLSGTVAIQTASILTSPSAKPIAIESANARLASSTPPAGTIEAAKLEVDKIALTQVKANFKFAGGVLFLDPVSAGVFGGQLAGTVAMDTRAGQSSVTAKAKLIKVDASQ